MEPTASLLATLTGRPVAPGAPGAPLRLHPHELTIRIRKAWLMVGVSLAMAAAMVPAPRMALLPLGLAAWFLGEALRQRARRALRYVFDAGGLTRQWGPWRTALPWERLGGLRLRFRPHRRGAVHGELVLTLWGGGRWFRLDSTMPRFSALLEQAAAVAARRDLRLDVTTLSNLRTLGLWGRG